MSKFISLKQQFEMEENKKVFRPFFWVNEMQNPQPFNYKAKISPLTPTKVAPSSTSIRIIPGKFILID